MLDRMGWARRAADVAGITTMKPEDVRVVRVTVKQVYIGMAIVAVCAVLLFVVPFALKQGFKPLRLTPTQAATGMLLFPVHELLHVVGFLLGGAKRKDIGFGFSWRAMVPYVDLRAPMEIWRFRFAALLPGIVTGVVPALLGLFLSNGALVAVGTVLTVGAGGDVVIVYQSRALKRGALLKVEG
jgi:hypothetical protein